MRKWFKGRHRENPRQDSARHGREPKVVGVIKVEDEPPIRPDKVRRVKAKVSLGYVETGVIIDRVVEGVVDKVT